MPDVELARRDGVELIRTGTWGASTGSWTPTKKDILAAVEAMKCPAVGKPILTIGHVDKRFTPRASGHDGEPGIGWVDNLRAGEDGELLIGDYVGVPAWIDQIMASAWPKRSIEGKYNYRCALSHTHDFALDAVSLLGTTPPAIPTLRSLNDVAELYGVEIAASEDHSGDSVYAIVLAAAEIHTGAMVALIPTVEDAERLAVDGGEPADQLHVTLAYFGEAADLGSTGQQDIIDKVSSAANGLPVIPADVFSVNAFNPGEAEPDRDTCLVYGLSGDMLDAVHDLIDEALWGAPIPVQHRPWVAHLTAVYTDDLGKIADLAGRMGPVRFDRLRLAFGGQHVDIPLIGEVAELAEEPSEAVAAAAGDDELKDYWLHGAGLKRWATAAHPWTALYRLIKKHVGNADKARRIASDWYREHFGHMPNQKVKASGGEADSAPSADPAAPTEGTPPAEPSAPILPAAEPEPDNPEPKEDLVSTELSAVRSRLGLSDDADLDAITAAVDALKVKAETPAPTPEMVAASVAAEAEKSELQTTVSKLEEQMTEISTELAAARAAQAATVKASVFDAAVKDGKLKPADREQWEKDYDEAPGAITRVLASIAPGTAVPVMASGTTGPAEPATSDDDWDAIVARIDSPKGV
ncbi:phage protease [Actinoplanes sp. CA-051413]|uniref:phage protease n=1 Tax=Actinoplanes sp. CA-051413 TaxID=3239899 RepID=UPI003D95B044